VEPLVESFFAESATKDLKFLDPTLIETIALLEQQIDKVKEGISQIPKNSCVTDAERFLEKWKEHESSS